MTWDYTDEAYQTQAAADERWHVERLLRHGLGDERINPQLLKKYWKELRMPENMRAFLALLLWDEKF
jgi:hypothetical protein